MMRTLFEKIWQDHVVVDEKAAGAPAVLYVEFHLVHEVTSPQAFNGLRARKLEVRRPDRTLATMDHSIPTTKKLPLVDEAGEAQLATLERNCAEFGIRLYDQKSD